MAISGHEHSTLGPVLGKVVKGLLLYVHLATPQLCATFWIPACHWQGRGLEALRLQPRGGAPCPQCPAQVSSGAAAWLSLSDLLQVLFHSSNKVGMIVDVSLRDILCGPRRAD